MSIYERELKGVLQGNKKVLENMIKSCDGNIKKIFGKTCEKPFIVIR
ncbi:MAG: Holliday junction resolvase, partial [Euryarchaeota archaeon CG01_land_8_20_14_3_00_38_12]